MKNKMQSMLPKIIGITVLAGVVTFIAATVFKLLLAGTVLVGTVTLIRKFAGKKRKQLSHNKGNQNFFEMKKNNFQNPFHNKMASVNDAAIYPIN